MEQKIYERELISIKSKITETQKKVIYTINNEMILLYYEIGGYINSHKSWGSKYVQRLADDLKEYEGMSYRNLQYMREFNKEFTLEEIMHQLGAQIPWRSLIEIMTKCKTKESRLWYIEKTHENSWSRSTLIKQIKAKAYERNIIEPVVSKGIKDYDSPFIKEILKDTYVLDILGNEFNNEKELKDKLIEGMLSFIKELGKGFALIDREYKLKYKSKTYYIDLLFYNYLLHAFVVVEIKIGEYKVEYYGQLKNYVVIVDKVLSTDKDNKTIGILLCKDGDKSIVKTTFENDVTPMVFSTYILLENINKYIK